MKKETKKKKDAKETKKKENETTTKMKRRTRMIGVVFIRRPCFGLVLSGFGLCLFGNLRADVFK